MPPTRSAPWGSYRRKMCAREVAGREMNDLTVATGLPIKTVERQVATKWEGLSLAWGAGREKRPTNFKRVCLLAMR